MFFLIFHTNVCLRIIINGNIPIKKKKKKKIVGGGGGGLLK